MYMLLSFDVIVTESRRGCYEKLIQMHRSVIGTYSTVHGNVLRWAVNGVADCMDVFVDADN